MLSATRNGWKGRAACEALARLVASIRDCAPQAVAATKTMLHRLSWPETCAGIGDWEAYAAEIFARSRAARIN